MRLPVSDRLVLPYRVPTSISSDPVLREFFPEFVTQWLHDLTVVWPDIEVRHEKEELYRFGHTIKGSFLQFGLRDLSAVGKDIMADAEREDWASARQCVEGLRVVMSTLKDELDNKRFPL